jgi:hypothetical protein
MLMPAQIPPQEGSAGRMKMIDMDSAPWAHDILKKSCHINKKDTASLDTSLALLSLLPSNK